MFDSLRQKTARMCLCSQTCRQMHQAALWHKHNCCWQTGMLCTWTAPSSNADMQQNLAHAMQHIYSCTCTVQVGILTRLAQLLSLLSSGGQLLVTCWHIRMHALIIKRSCQSYFCYCAMIPACLRCDAMLMQQECKPVPVPS